MSLVSNNYLSHSSTHQIADLFTLVNGIGHYWGIAIAAVPARETSTKNTRLSLLSQLITDLDADSQNEAPNAAMSGLETDSESEPPHEDDAGEQLPCQETSYVPFQEEEFGEVSGRHFATDEFVSVNFGFVFLFCSKGSKWRSWPRRTRVSSGVS